MSKRSEASIKYERLLETQREAAGDMYDALRSVLHDLEARDMKGPAVVVRDALAKAEGRS